MESEKKYTPADIEELKKKDPSELTPKERSLVNLKPIVKGEVRNPDGRPKGAKNWSTHFQKLMGDEEFLQTIIKGLPKDWNGLVGEYPADVIAAGLIAVATREVAKAISSGGEISEKTLRLLDRINHFGYGDKVVHDVDDSSGFFEKVHFNFEVVDAQREES